MWKSYFLLFIINNFSFIFRSNTTKCIAFRIIIIIFLIGNRIFLYVQFSTLTLSNRERSWLIKIKVDVLCKWCRCFFITPSETFFVYLLIYTWYPTDVVLTFIVTLMSNILYLLGTLWTFLEFLFFSIVLLDYFFEFFIFFLFYFYHITHIFFIIIIQLIFVICFFIITTFLILRLWFIRLINFIREMLRFSILKINWITTFLRGITWIIDVMILSFKGNVLKYSLSSCSQVYIQKIGLI